MNNITTNNNKRIICKECGKPFIFSEGEQKFYIDKLLKDPTHCPDCRINRKGGNTNA